MDASQIEAFEKCPRAWYYGYVLNLEPRRSHRAFSVGSYVHDVLAYYYSNKEKQSDIGRRQQSALTYARLPTTRDKYGIDKVEEKEYEPGFLIKRLQHYFIRWESEDETTETVAVEQGFSHLLYEDNQRRYILEGKIDHIAYRQGLGLIVEDHKTQSRSGERYELNHQVFNYYNFVKPEYFVYNYIGLQEKPNDKTFVRQIYKPHPGMIEQWKAEVMKTFGRMEAYIRDSPRSFSIFYGDKPKPFFDEPAFPRQRAACDGKYGICQFHNICSVPDDSKFKLAVIDSFKEKDEKWRAWT